MLEAEQLPASIADLDTGLTDVDGKSFTHIVLWRIDAFEKR
jgi:hypothetical protein